jgi:predicted acyl esterase
VPQANLAAVLSLVAPDGKATLVTFGVLNLTHRDSHAAPDAPAHRQPVDATLQLNVIGQRLPAGHRLRLALSQAYWPIIWPSAKRRA